MKIRRNTIWLGSWVSTLWPDGKVIASKERGSGHNRYLLGLGMQKIGLKESS